VAEPGDADEGAERALVDRALAGDADALEQVVTLVRDPVYRLALRMEWRPDDAEDATQEVLVRVVTNLASWRGRASLTTWAYRVAANHLANRRRARDRAVPTFATMGDELDRVAGEPTYAGVDAELLADEVRLSCTQAMLQCLDAPERLAYVFGDVLRLPGRDAAWALGVSDAAYRKRLQRARAAVRAFTAGRCGLLHAEAPCRCDRRITRGLATGRLRHDRQPLARHPVAPAEGRGADVSAADVRAAGDELRELGSVGALMRSHPAYAAPGAVTEAVVRIVRSGRYRVLGPADGTGPGGSGAGGTGPGAG
jgi:RNA polymerase sigma factor (sigma-70 family)